MISARNRHYLKDKNMLERTQHKFTRLFKELRVISYEDRLEKLGLWSLEERRSRCDLIELFKMVKGHSDVPWSRFFQQSNVTSTRGHNCKLVKSCCSTECRLHFFSLRTINRWNSLSQDLIDSSSVNSFKSRHKELRRRKLGFFKD